ncbi:ornithine decarboxylase-like [Mercenaria mercenaria]|uniref:ornithine decarboxylase-like n=1 Tax=Mercenaria mercenaria TaxID=6596 RepID=UPI00234EFDC7|nr:ornithine decarboxylase-like [Mercenaria mercenaria]
MGEIVAKSKTVFRLILRILPQEQFDATDSFENKFGCPSFQTRDLLQLAKELELRVDGVSFHVGTGIKDPRAYIATLKQSRDVFEIARGIGFNMKLLDIGGGFPGVQNTSDFFREITNVVNETLDDIFPPAEGVDIIAEPGRYVVASAYNVVVNIIGKRFFPENPLLRETGNATVKDICEGDSNTVMYYVNDSVFGSFLAGGLYEPGSIRYVPKLIKCEDDAVSHESMIWGFTCPPKDCLNPSVRMPELGVGDWLYFEDMGAYTNSISSNFNGLETPEIKYFCLESLWFEVFSGQPQRNE